MSRATDELRALERHAQQQSCLYGWTDPDVLPPWVWMHLTDAQAEGLRPMTLWRWLLRSSGLNGTTRAVGLWLSEWIREDEGKRIAAPCKLDELADISGFARRTVERSLATLGYRAWIASVCTDGHKALHWPAYYVLHLPAGIECPCGCNVPRPVKESGRDTSESRVEPQSESGLDTSESPPDTSLSPPDTSESPSRPDTVTGPSPTGFPALDPAASTASPDGDRTHKPGGNASLPKSNPKPARTLDERLAYIEARMREDPDITEDAITNTLATYRQNWERETA